MINFIAAYGTHSSITGATTLVDQRAAATALVLGGLGARADRLEFLNSTGAYASLPNGVTTTGLDAIDLWIGGLAEEKNPFGGMLGSTFNFIFENQLEKLQDGDRFYYLERTAGLAFNAELESNSFAKLIMANTDAPICRRWCSRPRPGYSRSTRRSNSRRGRRRPRRPDRRHFAHATGDPRQPKYCRTGYELPAVHRTLITSCSAAHRTMTS